MTVSFWKTIEQVPGLATDTRDWQARLADSWEHAKPYLPETSMLAKQVDCPHPGGEHCPRHVVRHPDGTVRAVCGDPARLCKAQDLTLDDIRIRELDRRKLFGDVAAALDLTTEAASMPNGRVLHLGDHAISAGRRFPVFASLAGARDPLSIADVLDLGRRNLPLVLLVASLRVIDAEALQIMRSMQGRVLTFGECLRFAPKPKTGLEPSAPPATIFAPEIAALVDTGDTQERPVMDLPADARWGDLRFSFVSNGVVNVSFKSQPPKRIEPDQLGMKDNRNGKATRKWRLLLVCAALGGALPRSFPVQTIRGRRPSAGTLRILDEFQRGYDRQRQQLAAALKAHFGIDAEPFSVSDDCYEAAFLVDASGLKQGRADQRDRNFADDD